MINKDEVMQVLRVVSGNTLSTARKMQKSAETTGDESVTAYFRGIENGTQATLSSMVYGALRAQMTEKELADFAEEIGLDRKAFEHAVQRAEAHKAAAAEEPA